MNDNQMQDRVLDILGSLAPEVSDVHSLKAVCACVYELDLDSTDFLNFLIGIDQEFAVEIRSPTTRSSRRLNQYLRLPAAEDSAKVS